MKVRGKVTAGEWCLLVLAAAFLAALVCLYVHAYAAAPGAAYSIHPGHPAETVVTPEAAGPVDINTAGLEELETLKGVGPALAQRILDHREANGPFTAVEELMEVRGIGESTLEKFRDHIVVGVSDAKEESGEGGN